LTLGHTIGGTPIVMEEAVQEALLIGLEKFQTVEMELASAVKANLSVSGAQLAEGNIQSPKAKHL